MTDVDRDVLLSELERGMQDLEGALAGVDDSHSRWRSAPAAWSIVDCVEHVAKAERFMLTLIEHATPDASLIRPRFEQGLLRAGADRRRKFESPDAIKPQGTPASLAGALEELRNARSTTLQWLAGAAHDLRAAVVPHPVAGTVNTYECLLLIALHPQRHASQVREIRELPGFEAMA